MVSNDLGDFLKIPVSKVATTRAESTNMWLAAFGNILIIVSIAAV
jgi:hypothetical protein